MVKDTGGSGRAEKPPLGCKPEAFYQEQRACDLAAAINRYVQGNFIRGDTGKTVVCWCRELIEVLERINHQA